MNHSTCSSECLHGMHSACDYEDCACKCHLRDYLDREYQEPDQTEDEEE